jgi:GT2 family glycosyltransferase
MPAHVGLLLNYRDAARSISCVGSLLAQGADAVLVVDNSADQQASAALISAHFANEPRVVVDISPRNLGFAAGVNRGLQRCAERHPDCRVLLINNDALLLTGGLARLSAALDHSPSSILSFADIDQHGRVTGPAYYQRLTGLLTLKPTPGSFMHASGCCLLIDAARHAGPLFDEDFFMYGEDCELGWRLSHRPQSTVYVEETLVFHEGTASSGLGSVFYEERMVAAHWILAKKLATNAVEKWLLYAGRSVMLSTRALLRAFRFRSFVPIRALWAGWKLAFVYDPLLSR